MFNDKVASRELRDYRKHGAPKTTNVLIDAIREMGIAGMVIMDIGGGVGAIQEKLLKAGADRAVSVDASSGYTEAARRFAEEEGFAEQVTRVHGDFTKIAPTLDQVDVVTLDRVLCCFDNMPLLVKHSAEKAGRVWGAVFPRDFWWLKAGMGLVRSILSLINHPMRFYAHSTDEVDTLLKKHGLERRFHRKMGIWQIVIYERSQLAGD